MAQRLQIEPGAYFAAAAGLLLLPLRFWTAIAAAAIFHEFCHYFAAKIMKIKVHCLRISGKGCVLDTQPMTRGQELICAVAGPAGSLLLLVLIHRFPLLALCGAVQGLFNLLPLYPLDGGRILYCVGAVTAGECIAEKVCRCVEIAVLLLALCLAIFLALCVDWGLLPAAMIIYCAGRIGNVKNFLQTGATQSTIELPFSKR